MVRVSLPVPVLILAGTYGSPHSTERVPADMAVDAAVRDWGAYLKVSEIVASVGIDTITRVIAIRGNILAATRREDETVMTMLPMDRM